jgi:hypothetical protein
MAGYGAFHRHSLGQDLPDWLSRRRHARFALTWTWLGAEADALAWTHAALPACGRQPKAWPTQTAPRAAALRHALRQPANAADGCGCSIPYACVAPPEFDVVVFAQSITCEGGPDPDDALAAYMAHLPRLTGRQPGLDDVAM